MKSNALAIANFFIDKGVHEKNPITLLRLVKYVYIAHGYILALLDKNILNPRFDCVEAWKFGPVIPSVYHSFKHYQNNPITEKACVLKSTTDNGNMIFETPIITDKDVIMILDFVWDRYKHYSVSKLVALLHRVGTPWQYCYREGENRIILDEMTKYYYKSIVDNATKNE